MSYFHSPCPTPKLTVEPGSLKELGTYWGGTYWGGIYWVGTYWVRNLLSPEFIEAELIEPEFYWGGTYWAWNLLILIIIVQNIMTTFTLHYDNKTQPYLTLKFTFYKIGRKLGSLCKKIYQKLRKIGCIGLEINFFLVWHLIWCKDNQILNASLEHQTIFFNSKQTNAIF